MSNYKEEFEITASFPAIGINKKPPSVNYKDIRENEAAFNMLLNQVQETDRLYSMKVRELEEKNGEINSLKQEINTLNKKSSERKNSVIFLSIAEIITSIGVGGLFTSTPLPFVLCAGIIMTALSLYLNFKK